MMIYKVINKRYQSLSINLLAHKGFAQGEPKANRRGECEVYADTYRFFTHNTSSPP